MATILIKRPLDAQITVATDNGSLTGIMSFAPDFGSRYTNNFRKAQMYVDSEVVKFCSVRVPYQTGRLQKSGVFGTNIGDGEVRYTVSYAAQQYYNTPLSRPYDANRGGLFFERGKAAEKERILQGAAKIAAGGGG